MQGIAEDYDKKKIVKTCKKVRDDGLWVWCVKRSCYLLLQEFACNGTVVDHAEYGEVIQLQGDQRKVISEFLLQTGLAKKDQIKMHGF